MSQQLVSCIIPVYNGERYLAETLASVLAQTYEPIEIIVADDGSTDDTPRVVRACRGRIAYLWQENAGAPMARNLGLAHARGAYIGFLDADDKWHPEKIARQANRFSTRPGLQVSFTLIQSYWSEDVPEARRIDSPGLAKPVPGYVCPTMLARREVFDVVGAFEASLRHASEPAWILKAAELGVVMELVPEVLVARRLHAANESHRAARRVYEEYLHFLKATLDRRRQGSEGVRYDFHARGAATGVVEKPIQDSD